MNKEETRFCEYLADHGLRLTAERRMILREVFRRHDHFEAEDVVIGLRRTGERVSRASVYRTLPLLVRSGLLRSVHSDEKHAHFEHVFGHDHHDHLICTECGRTVEFKHEGIEETQDKVCAEHGFTCTHHRLEITGICADCRRSED